EFRDIVIAARERLGDADAIQGQKGLFLSIHALSRALDPYCGIPDGRERRQVGPDGEFGPGLELEPEQETPRMPTMELDQVQQPPRSNRRGPLRIVDVAPGGPAQRASIQPGDLITHIDGHELRVAASSQLQLLVQRLLAPTDDSIGKVKLTI